MKVNKTEKRKNEKGAAMVMVLLVSLMLLTASVGLLMESSMNTQNVSDATAEQQAYNAAESGLQSTINVLRGYSEYQKAGSDTITFRKAVTPSTSNAAGDTNTAGRLSRWLTYNYSSDGSGNKDRIKLGSGTDYSYAVTVSDPDETGSIIAFKTKGEVYDPVSKTWKTLDQDSNQIYKLGTSPNTVDLTYKKVDSSGNLNVSSGSANTNFGTFKIIAPAGVNAIVLTEDLRFRITVTMLAPYNSIRVMRGALKLKPSSNSVLQFDFDSAVYEMRGSLFTLTNDPLDLSIGVNSQTNINGTVTQAEPYRIVVRSVGYGPRGAKKELEATVQKNFFNGLSAPATLTLIGVASSTNGNFTFSPGTSTNVTYSGDDIASTLNIPSIGTTIEANLTTIRNELAANNVKTVPNPPAENVLSEIPFWLESPTNLDATINDLKTVAKASGRYYPSGQTPPNFGDTVTSKGITFVDGNLTLNKDGGGILVCTGNLTLNGNFSFNGLIIVTGSGGVQRSGGGNGLIQGNMVVAPYNPANLGAGFLAPKYDISGGGTSTIRFDSSSVANGMTAVSNFVLGVAEK